MQTAAFELCLEERRHFFPKERKGKDVREDQHGHVMCIMQGVLQTKWVS